MDLQTPSNGLGFTIGRDIASSTGSLGSAAAVSSLFAAGVQILVGLKSLASPSEAFVWDGSWFGHPGTELIDMYAGE